MESTDSSATSSAIAHLEQISGAPFLEPDLLVNSVVKNFNDGYNPGAPNLYHRDVWHAFDAAPNKIVYGLTATDRISAQVINIESGYGPLAGAGVAKDYAFVNIDAVTTLVARDDELNFGGPQYSQIEGNEQNIVFKNINMPNQRWIMDTTIYHTLGDFHPTDVVFQDNPRPCIGLTSRQLYHRVAGSVRSYFPELFSGVRTNRCRSLTWLELLLTRQSEFYLERSLGQDQRCADLP